MGLCCVTYYYGAITMRLSQAINLILDSYELPYTINV
jgi:hypothetical protein